MYLQTSRLQYNLQGIGVFQTARSDNRIQAEACDFIISDNCRNASAGKDDRREMERSCFGLAVSIIQRIGDVLVFSDAVRRFALRDRAVADGLRRAVADAGHAVRTLIAPDGLAVLERDIAQRAQARALAAAHAGV